MFRRDYILQLIEEFFTALSTTRSAAEKGHAQRVRSDLSALSEYYLNMTLEKLVTEPLLTIKIGRQPFEIAMAADLLTEYAAMERRAGRDSTLPEARALRLYGHALDQDRTLRYYGDRTARIDELLLDTQDAALDELHLIRFGLYEHLMRFDTAEDLLFRLIEAGYGDAAIQGRVFYERLLKLDDRVLEDGGLPRDEVEQSLTELTPAGDT